MARNMSVFHKMDEFGIILLLKLSMITATLLSAVSQTACFVASETGNLDRVLCDAKLSKSDHIRYRRLAVIHSVMCWTIIMAQVLIITVSLFLAQEGWDMSITPLGVHVFVSDQLFLVIFKLFTGLVYLFIYAAWIFTLSVNYIGNLLLVLQCTARRTISGTQSVA